MRTMRTIRIKNLRYRKNMIQTALRTEIKTNNTQKITRKLKSQLKMLKLKTIEKFNSTRELWVIKAIIFSVKKRTMIIDGFITYNTLFNKINIPSEYVHMYIYILYIIRNQNFAFKILKTQ